MHYVHDVQKGDNMPEFNQSKYINEFAKEKYDRIIVQVPKGQKAIIDEKRKEKGYSSLNAYICELIRRENNEDNSNINVSNISQSGTNNSINIRK